MKISESSGINLLKAYASQVKNNKAGKEQNKKSGGVSGGDRAEISSEAREIQDIMAKLRKLPGVREELVNSLREKIQDGSYHPDNLEIAQGIIEEYKKY